MNNVNGQVEFRPTRSSRLNAAYIPFSYGSDGSNPVDPHFDYDFCGYSGAGDDTITLTFEWDLPDNTVVVTKPTFPAAPNYTISGRVLTVDFSDVDAADRYEFMVCFSYEGLVYEGAQDNSKSKEEDALSCASSPEVENRQLGSIFGKVAVSGGAAVASPVTGGYYVEEQGGGQYRIYIGEFDAEKTGCIVSSDSGSPIVTYSGDEGFVLLNFGTEVDRFFHFVITTVL